MKKLADMYKDTKVSLKYGANLNEFRNILHDMFKMQPPKESLILAMYERFKPFKLSDGVRENCHVLEEKEVDMLDFMLALNLLARITYDKKLKLLFELCDDDDDKCMTPEDILFMLQRVERVFAIECARVDMNSATLNNFVADNKAEHNFHFIMGMINHLSHKKNLKIKMDNEKANGKDGQNKKNNDDNNGAPKEEDEDNLITYKEFKTAIKSLKSLHKTILPRTLSFKEVL